MATGQHEIQPPKPQRRPFPQRVMHRGGSVILEPLTLAHVPELWNAAHGADQSWFFLRYGPPQTIEAMSALVRELASREDQPFWAARPLSSGRAEGWLSLCDIYPDDAAIEIGSIWFSPRMQRSRATTEAVFLLMRHALDDLGYQRMVWRCTATNAASMRAAERYGFRGEGIWRHAAIIKGVTRDLAWHSILSEEWPAARSALESWLDDANFRPDATAISSLSEIRAGLLGNAVTAGPAA